MSDARIPFSPNRYHTDINCPLLSQTPDPAVTDCTNIRHRELAKNLVKLSKTPKIPEK